MTRWKWWLGGSAAAVVVFALVGFFAVPPLAKAKLEELLSRELERGVTVEAIEFNPFSLRAAVSGFTVADRTAGAPPLFAFRRLEVDGSWRSLVERAPVVSGLRLVEPSVHLVREAPGRYNVQDLIDKWLARPRDPEAPPPRFAVANIELTGGRLLFEDRAVAREHRVDDLLVRLPFVSSLPVHQEVNVEPKLAAKVNGTTFDLAARSRPFQETRPSALQLDIAPIDLVPYLAYLPIESPLQVRSALLGAKLLVDFAQPKGAAPAIKVSGEAALTKLDVRERDGEPLVAAASIAVTGLALEPLGGVFDVGKVAIDQPYVMLRRRSGEARFWQRALDAIDRARREAAARQAAAPAQPPVTPAQTAAKGPDAAAAPAAGPRWRVGEVVAQGGRVDTIDENFTPRPLAAKMEQVALRIGEATSDATRPVPIEASVVAQTGERARVALRLTREPLLAEGEASVDDIALKNWWWLAEPHVEADLVDGTAALKTGFTVRRNGEANEIRLRGSGLDLRSLRLRQRWDKAEFARLESLTVADVDVDLTPRTATVGRVQASTGVLRVVRGEDGRTNLERIAGTPAARPAPGGTKAPSEPSTPSAAETGGWTWVVKQIALERLGASLRDLKAGSSADVALADFGLRAEDIGNAPKTRGKVALRGRVGKGGSVDVSGPVSLEPPTAKLKVRVSGLPILPAQPYFAPYVNLVVTSGTVAASGEAHVEAPRGQPLRAGYRGSVTVSEFAAITKAEGDDLLRWKTLHLEAIDASNPPVAAQVGEIALSDFYARLIIRPDGRFNLQDVVVPRGGTGDPGAAAGSAPEGGARRAESAARRRASPAPAAAAHGATLSEAQLMSGAVSAPAPAAVPAAAAAPASPAAALPIRIGRITLANGNIDFTDLFVRPNYSANLTGMNGTVSTLAPDTPGDMELRGRIDNAGSVEITGKLNPLAPTLFLDVQARARDIDLPRTSPYSIKYLGYGIEKGKLSANVKYKVEDRRLQAENNIVLDQLTFGEKVESPTATKLPVLFAVSLLKDRNGVIDVNLPIGGSLDDPKFSVGGIVLQIIINVITKAVTAPFTLLAGIAGGGGELSYVEFAAGSARLDAAAEQRLGALAKALTERPALKLDLAGRVDPEPDREALRKREFDRALKVQKLKASAAGGSPTPEAVDAVRIEPAEYTRYLTLAYRAGDFAKPRNAIGLLRDLPPEEMEKLLGAAIRVPDDALAKLAADRASAAKEYLLGRGLPGERLFLVAPKLTRDGVDPGKPATRVDMALK